MSDHSIFHKIVHAFNDSYELMHDRLERNKYLIPASPFLRKAFLVALVNDINDICKDVKEVAWLDHGIDLSRAYWLREITKFLTEL